MLSTVLLAILLIQSSIAGYVLVDNYEPSTFFEMFDFYTGSDPTDGTVEFVDQSTAQSSGLISNSNSSVVLAVDSKQIMESRSSIRIQSKNSYNLALIVADVVHMPGGICGTWPALWTIGPDWPLNGEIDIVEGVNAASVNAMTLHTGPGCSISSTGSFLGEVKTSNCWIDAPSQGTNVGCGIEAAETTTYGTGFNSAGGGVYAMEWTAEGITVWQFPRSQIPNDITNGNPVPSSWSTSQAKFEGNCNFQTSFSNQSIVVDTTFCGQWAGQQGVWEADPVCSKMAATCSDYVQNNPADFAEAYWQFNSIKVYQLQDGFIGSQTYPAPASTQYSSRAVSPTSTTTTTIFQTTLTTFATLTSSTANSSAIKNQAPLSVIPVNETSVSNMTAAPTASGRITAVIPEEPSPSTSIQALRSTTKSSPQGFIGDSDDGHAIGAVKGHSSTTPMKPKSTPSTGMSIQTNTAAGFIGQRL